jgi:hypothetical protein
LFSVHSTHREAALRAALPAAFRRSYADAAGEQRPLFDNLTIASAPRDHDHPDGPAGPSWALWTPQSSHQTALRHRLAELPFAPPVPTGRQSFAVGEHLERTAGGRVAPQPPTPEATANTGPGASSGRSSESSAIKSRSLDGNASSSSPCRGLSSRMLCSKLSGYTTIGSGRVRTSAYQEAVRTFATNRETSSPSGSNTAVNSTCSACVSGLSNCVFSLRLTRAKIQ